MTEYIKDEQGLSVGSGKQDKPREHFWEVLTDYDS